MKPDCDEAMTRSGGGGNPCVEAARVWVLVATIAGSSNAFIDGTVVNVAPPVLQGGFRASVTDVQ